MRLTYRGVLAAAAAALALLAGPAPAKADIIFGLSQSGNQIFAFDSGNPGVILRGSNVTGLNGATLVGIDFRPSDNALVGVGSFGNGTGAVFQINPFTGAATQINTTPNPFTLTGTGFGVDFNPVANALRIVTNGATNNNLRITAGGTGTVTTDTDLNPAGVGIVGAAYSNNVPGGVGGQTTLYDLAASGLLYTQGTVNFAAGQPPPATSPNTGTLFLVGGGGPFGTTEVGFDIGSNGRAFVSSGNSLFTIDLATGNRTSIGTAGGPPLRDIAVAPDAIAAVIPEPASMAVFGALAGMAFVARRRRVQN